ncbi:MAG TPA: dihydrodipicolinate synthase family protein [Solirubrobacteraceae bacterium]|nr:dihydrodipicolinate synthase family protein [Solirubrobacteraceae bacterium]
MTTTTSTALNLPRAHGAIEPYSPGAPSPYTTPHGPPRSRVCFAAAHVVADPLAPGDPEGPARLDWDATLAFRRHLWSHGFRVAEAMDTAQRGMGLDWPATQELIRRSVADAKECGGGIAAGAGTDHLAPTAPTLDDVRAAYDEQCAFVEGTGAQVVLMASRALTAAARGADDYADVYGHVLGQLAQPAILHWLGPAFDPALAGYWGDADLDAASETMLAIIGANRDKVDGVKVSLLDHGREVALRRRLPDGVRLYTGDDFHYPELIRGDEHGHSDALLGIFDAIAPAAAAALAALDAGDAARYDEILAPTVALSRHVFQAPTYQYKTGIVFLAYLNDHQHHFRMVGGRESARSITHLAELFVLADGAGLLRDPDRAAARMRGALELAGVEQP